MAGARVLIMALPRDVHLRPSFGIGYGDVGQLERAMERPVGAVDATGAGEVEAMVEGALVADAEWVRDVDVAAPRFASSWPPVRLRRHLVVGSGSG